MSDNDRKHPQGIRDEEDAKLRDELIAARQQIARLEAARSELKSAEHALRESEERFRIALQHSKIVVYNQDRDLRYTWIYNPQLGFTPEGIIGKTDGELLLPEDAVPLDRIKRQVLESGTGRRETVRTIIRGEAYYYDLTVEPLRDADGGIIGVTGASRDITEQVRVESERDRTLAALRERTHDLGERVKELNCLYGLSRLREKPGVSLEEIYQGTAELIPPAWQHPETTGARVVVDAQDYCTENFAEDAPNQQAADILVYGQVCGRVEVCYREDRPEGDEGPFLREERSLLNAIARRLGRITEHKRAEGALRIARDDLEQRVKERTAELTRGHQRERVLNALLRLSVEAISLDEQLGRALDEVLSIPWLPVQPQGAIFLVDDEAPSGTGTLELRAQRGFPPASRAACKRVSFGQCLCGRAADSQDLLFAEHEDERHEIQQEGLFPHGHYCVPILSGDRTIGVIALYLEQGHRRDAQQEDFVRAVAHTLAGIIERKRVEEALQQSEQRLREVNQQLEQYGRTLEQEVARRTREIERRRQVAESLRDILAVLNSDRPLDEILDYIVTEARRLLGSDTSAIYRLSEPQGRFEVRTVQGQHADLVAPLQFPPGYRRALLEGQPVAVSDATAGLSDLGSADPGESVLPADLAVQCPAMLAVPLIFADEVYGGLVLFYSEPQTFSGEEIDLAVAFADQAALAIENARLHQRAEEAAVLEERGRLARDLHDSVTQSLYSITLLAEGWKRLDRTGRLEDTEEPLTELGEIAQQALKEMRLMIHELRPPDLEEVGLLGALHQRLGAVEKRAGVEARLVADDVADLSPGVEECLYRIALEALNNALKHAGATAVVVRVRAEGNRVELEVVDNGCGFDVETLEEERGLGLQGMRERAEQMGGVFVVDSTPPEGTRVSVSMGTGRSG